LFRRANMNQLFDPGVTFDRAVGRFEFDKGLMRIPDFSIEGSGGYFSFTSDVDLLNETLNGELVVTLPLVENIPWVAALAGGLPVAAGTYLISKVFEDQVNQLDPNDDADRIAELQAQIEALNETITKLDNGDLLPKLSLIDDLVGADGEIDFATLSASIAGSDGNSILKGADDATATEFAVSLGSSEVSIDKDELNSLLAAQKENESYQEALRSGFADTAEGKKAATEAQLKSIAAAKEFEVSTDSKG